MFELAFLTTLHSLIFLLHVYVVIRLAVFHSAREIMLFSVLYSACFSDCLFFKCKDCFSNVAFHILMGDGMHMTPSSSLFIT